MDRGYRHVQDRCVKLRRSGGIPYGWITDASRRGYFTVTYNNAADFLRRTNSLYRANLWQDAAYYCEVWVESRSIAGVVQDDCEELAVSLYPAGGFTSISLAFRAAEYINDEADGREVVILYIGDYDPAGVLIDVAVERELREHLDPESSWSSAASASRQSRLPNMICLTKPRKTGDKRALHITDGRSRGNASGHHARATPRRDRVRCCHLMLLKSRRLPNSQEREQLERAAKWLTRARRRHR